MLIDLSGNENPYRRDEEIKGFENINRYIEHVEIAELVKAVSKYSRCAEDRLLLGAGTENLVEKVLLKFHKNKTLYVINPNSSEYISFAKDIGMKVRRIQLTVPDFAIDWKKYDVKDAVIVIDYPNNPTGRLLIEEGELKALLKNNIVIIDEAGYEYSNKTFVGLIEEYENLCILRTFDKAFGLAGIKAGYAMFGDELLKRISLRHEINRPSLFMCLEAFKDEEYLKNSVTSMTEEKEWLTKEFHAIDITVYDSFGNYLLVNTDIADLSLKLREKDIVIEDLSTLWLKGYYRISVGNKDENIALIKALKDIKK